MRKTYYTKNGFPYWVMAVKRKADSKNYDLGSCKLRFGGKNYILSFVESNKPEIAEMWCRVIGVSSRAGYRRSYRRSYGRSYGRFYGYRRTTSTRRYGYTPF